MGIRIMTDSMCDVPEAYINKYNIKVMPLTVHFGEESFRDGVDITMEEFHKRLEKTHALPTTSQVPPLEFLNVYREMVSAGDTVISIHGSSVMSGTHNSALLAKEQLGEADIHIVDTMAITLGAGMLVIKAARMAEEGFGAEAIVNELEESKKRLKSFFVLDTLKYLHKGGRISLSASVMGSILNIKPILTVNDGRMELLHKERGIKKALNYVFSTIRDSGWSLDGKAVAINDITDPEHLEALENMIVKTYRVKEIIRGEVGSVVATHGGPGAVALYFEA